MNLVGTEMKTEGENVLPLFGDVEVTLDPIQELLSEAFMNIEEEEAQDSSQMSNRLLASESQFPEQSLYVLDQQLQKLKDSLERIKFYLGDLDDLLPR